MIRAPLSVKELCSQTRIEQLVRMNAGDLVLTSSRRDLLAKRISDLGMAVEYDVIRVRSVHHEEVELTLLRVIEPVRREVAQERIDRLSEIRRRAALSGRTTRSRRAEREIELVDQAQQSAGRVSLVEGMAQMFGPEAIGEDPGAD